MVLIRRPMAPILCFMRFGMLTSTRLPLNRTMAKARLFGLIENMVRNLALCRRRLRPNTCLRVGIRILAMSKAKRFLPIL